MNFLMCVTVATKGTEHCLADVRRVGFFFFLGIQKSFKSDKTMKVGDRSTVGA